MQGANILHCEKNAALSTHHCDTACSKGFPKPSLWKRRWQDSHCVHALAKNWFHRIHPGSGRGTQITWLASKFKGYSKPWCNAPALLQVITCAGFICYTIFSAFNNFLFDYMMITWSWWQPGGIWITSHIGPDVLWPFPVRGFFLPSIPCRGLLFLSHLWGAIVETHTPYYWNVSLLWKHMLMIYKEPK